MTGGGEDLDLSGPRFAIIIALTECLHLYFHSKEPKCPLITYSKMEMKCMSRPLEKEWELRPSRLAYSPYATMQATLFAGYHPIRGQ